MTNAEENGRFYQETYSEGFTSDVPHDEELGRLIKTKFKHSEKNYDHYIALLRSLGVPAGAKILDFGCSWGYGSWQLADAGFIVVSFEISEPRCRYAREKLGVEAYDKLSAIPDRDYDVFFSSHVLEHVPSVSSVFQLARQKLRKGGLFVAITPNGSMAFRSRHPYEWNSLWGMVHPNFLDDVFYQRQFPDAMLASSPFDSSRLHKTGQTPGVVTDLSGIELLAVVRF